MKELAPILVPLIVFMVPIIAILTNHQRRMAELYVARTPQNNGEMESLRRELAEIKDLLRQQTIALDGRPPVAPVDVRERLR